MQVYSRGSRSRPAAASHSTLHTGSHSTLPTMLQLLCLLAVLSATVTGACEAPFKVVGEGCYYFSEDDDIDVEWTEARQYCLSLGSEVDLAMMDYVCDDFRNLGNYYVLEGKDDGSWKVTWIGATGEDNNWLWLDGRNFSTDSPYWFPDRPISSSGSIGMALYLTENLNMRMYLKELSTVNTCPFLCQNFSTALQH